MVAKTHGKATIGLLLRSVPYQQRSAREQLDFALTAAALEIPLRLYFQGASVMQLIRERDSAPARLPTGYRGWGSLTDLTEVHAHAEPEWLELLSSNGFESLLDLRPMSVQAMRVNLASCTRVLVL